MNVVDTLLERNVVFSKGTRFSEKLKIIPSMKTMIIGCVDPRVDPAELFNLQPGEAVVYRNVGGRVTPSTLETLTMLRDVAKANGGKMGPGWNLIILHHTSCGITCLGHSEDLAKHFGVSLNGLEDLAIKDPYVSVAVDCKALQADLTASSGFLVTGLVYDVSNGRVTTVVPSSVMGEIIGG